MRGTGGENFKEIFDGVVYLGGLTGYPGVSSGKIQAFPLPFFQTARYTRALTIPAANFNYLIRFQNYLIVWSMCEIDALDRF